jgi:hypothetical protein
MYEELFNPSQYYVIHDEVSLQVKYFYKNEYICIILG